MEGEWLENCMQSFLKRAMRRENERNAMNSNRLQEKEGEEFVEQ